MMLPMVRYTCDFPPILSWQYFNHNWGVFIMSKIVWIVLSISAAVCTSSAVFADSIVNAITCTVSEGKTLDDVQAANSKWLKWVRENVNPYIKSAVGTAIVGDQGNGGFMFADTYPDLATWAATNEALRTPEGKAIEALFDDVNDCSKNRLWRFEPTP
jgi:hypothetical protein